MSRRIAADNYFSMIPEWVLDAKISATAVRLYCVLQRYANSDGLCHPSRRTLAERCGCSTATIDRAVDELVDIRALVVSHRRTERGDQTSNLYTVVTATPYAQVNRPLVTDDDTPLFTSDEQTKAIINESQEPNVPTDKKPIHGKALARRDAVTLANANAGKHIAQQWWDEQTIKPIGKRAWHSLLAVCTAAVTSGHTAEAVLKALNEIGTVPSVGHLDRVLKNGSARFETARERQNREANELHAKYVEEETAVVTQLFKGLGK